MPSKNSSQQRNFLFILADDMGYWALGAAGNDEIHTPNLDKLASRGMRFENFFCASPVCSPARASILTGYTPSQHGVLDWIASGNVDRERMEREDIQNPYGGYVKEVKPIRYLNPGTTYTEQLAQAGYQMALSGKWHLGDSFTPQAGFSERWYTIGKGGACYFSPDIIEDGEISIRDTYVTDLFTQQALRYLDELQDDPFYLAVHYTAPHAPWGPEYHYPEDLKLYEDCPFSHNPDVPDHEGLQVPPVYGTPVRRENLTGYYAAITAMDRGIGQILDRLEALGLSDQTYVIFMSDNGMCMGHHGVWGKGNGTFPQNMYEESIKVPCIMAGPDIAQGVVNQQMLSQLDIYPTLLELAGLEPQEGPLPRAGRSFASSLQNPQAEPAEDASDRAIICEEYGTTRMIRTAKDKFVRRIPWGPHEYYNLQDDPQEEHNLFEEPKAQARILELSKQLSSWFASYSDPIFDGSHQPVTGLGQLDRLDESAYRLDKFIHVSHVEGPKLHD